MNVLLRSFALPALALFPFQALAGPLEVGVGLGASLDLPDPASADHTRFGPGPSLSIPVRYRIAPAALLRAQARFDVAPGQDRVTWAQEVDGHTVRVYDDDHFTLLTAGSLTVGADVEIPLAGPVAPYFGTGIGVAWVGTWHSFRGHTQILLDPESNDLADASNLDPYTTQLSFVTDLRAGAIYRVDEVLGFSLELGYSSAYLDAKALEKTAAALDARREAYGWNTFRVGVGLHFAL